jgi:tetraacyldisaccharide 4'-kinase
LTCVNPERDTVANVGDEALLLAAAAPTWAGRDRAAAVREAQANGSIVIMDDGMQNPHVAPTVSILVVDGETGLGNRRILPAGPLRESLADALKRASAMIVMGPDRHNIAKGVRIPVFHAHMEPSMPHGFSSRGRFVAFAGIAHPENFFATARKAKLDLANFRDFPDHYAYKEADIEALRLEAEVQGARLLTTEKDAVRLPPDFRAEVVALPVRLVFDTASEEKALLDLIAPRKRKAD